MYRRLQPLLTVQNLLGEATFYRNLGFALIEFGSDSVTVAYEESVLFGLVHSDDFDPDAANQFLSWQFGVESVEAIYQICREKQIEPLELPALQSWGEWILKLSSPNGYVVIFEGGQ